MSRVATLAKMIKPMATTQLTTSELVMKPPQESMLTADAGRPCSASPANAECAASTTTDDNHRWSAVLMGANSDMGVRLGDCYLPPSNTCFAAASSFSFSVLTFG